MAVQTYIFSLQNEGLKSRLDYFLTERETLREGEEAKSFNAIDMQGNKNLISFNNSDYKYQLLFIFSTHCRPCEENLINWQNLIEKINVRKISITGTSLDSLSATQIPGLFRRNRRLQV